MVYLLWIFRALNTASATASISESGLILQGGADWFCMTYNDGTSKKLQKILFINRKTQQKHWDCHDHIDLSLDKKPS